MKRLTIIFMIIMFQPVPTSAQFTIISENAVGKELHCTISFDPNSLIARLNFSEIDIIDSCSITFDLILAMPINTFPKAFFKELNAKPLQLNEFQLSKVSRALLSNTNPVTFVDFKWIGNLYCATMKLDLIKKEIPLKVIEQFEVVFSFPDEIQVNKFVNSTGLQSTSALNSNRITTLNKMGNQKDIYKSDEWIDFSKPYVKLGVNTDDIFRITFQDLKNLGVEISQVNPKTFKLIYKGSEVPIYLSSGSKANLEPSDYIEFIGLRNYGSEYRKVSAFAKPYNEYLDRYTDSSSYFLTWDGVDGKRVDIFSKNQISASDTMNYYYELIHSERDLVFDYSVSDIVRKQSPDWIENETWSENLLGVGTLNRDLTCKDIFPNKPFKALVKMQDFASDIVTNSHIIRLSINNTLLDTVKINKYEQVVIEKNNNSNILLAGSNRIAVVSLPTIGSVNSCLIDWIELEYPRKTIAVNDSLILRYNNQVNGKYTLKTSSFSDAEYSIWKYGKAYSKFLSNSLNGVISFNDEITDSSNYIIKKVSKIKSPKYYYFTRAFKNITNSQYLASYMIITNKKLMEAAKKYSSFIESNYRKKTAIHFVDEIYDQFSYGMFNPEAIKKFLLNSYYQSNGKNIENVLLLGSATYDYFGNRNKYGGFPKIENYVPSYGSPVSDNWFVTFDDTNLKLPQISIGRLPISNIEELDKYLRRHEKYLKDKYDDWNKRYLFFSGGKGDNLSELEQLKTANSYIAEKIISIPPVGGNTFHFYKTMNPVSNFGPFSVKTVQDNIDSGAVFICYIGHSGTRTWDNTIEDPIQLKNKVDRSSLITDFGCSTAKFAEPDIKSFATLTTLGEDGQALMYIGNSSLGFTSTAITAPKLFYEELLKDSTFNPSRALIAAKKRLLLEYGTSSINNLFSLTNTVIGDPIINLTIPQKPNLCFNRTSPIDLSDNINDSEDSIRVGINIKNIGAVRDHSFDLSIERTYNGITTITSKSIQIPKYSHSEYIWLKTHSMPGEHRLTIKLDCKSEIDEIYEDDNEIGLTFNVNSSQLRPLFITNPEMTFNNKLKFLNPTIGNSNSGMNLEVDTTNKFIKPIILEPNTDSYTTSFDLSILSTNKRYWLRTHSLSTNSYSSNYSLSKNIKSKYLCSDSISFANQLLFQTMPGSVLTLQKDTISIRVSSAGFHDGSSALVYRNGQNYVPANYAVGHHIVLFDKEDLSYKSYKYFNTYNGGATVLNDYKNFLDTISTKFLIAIAVSNDGRVVDTDLIAKIKSIGSRYIDKISFRSSWAILGYKGAKEGSVKEGFTVPSQGVVRLDTVINFQKEFGKFITNKIGPVSLLERIQVTSITPMDTKVQSQILFFNNSGVLIDTILINSNKEIDLSKMNLSKQPYFQLQCDLYGKKNASPAIKEIRIDFINVPELGINNQIVTLSKDSLVQGEKTNLNFSVYNAGESTASNFKVRVDLVKKDNSKEKLFEEVVDSIQTEKKKDFSLSYTTDKLTGSNQFQINIDSENSITELYKDNNFYSVPFYVKPNDKPASLKLTIDGNDILNGDYISSKPNFKIELNDESLIPITDTSKVLLYLNNKRIYFANNSGIMTYNYSSSNPKMVVNYNPTLSDGNYTLKVVGKNATDQIIDSTGIIRKFTVKNELQLLNAYNYPNPFKDDTYFTFKLTQLPDELKIIIYTIAGRKIKEIKLNSSELRFDFNRIPWDGRDEDGDLAANGVYLYKIISKKGSERTELTQKLSIIR